MLRAHFYAASASVSLVRQHGQAMHPMRQNRPLSRARARGIRGYHRPVRAGRMLSLVHVDLWICVARAMRK